MSTNTSKITHEGTSTALDGTRWLVKDPVYWNESEGTTYPVYRIDNGAEWTAPVWPDDYVQATGYPLHPPSVITRIFSRVTRRCAAQR